MKVYYLLCLSFLLSGCLFDNCEQLTIPQSEFVWIDAYDIGDTVIFKSVDSNYTDVFTTTLKTDEFTPCNKVSVSMYQKQEKRTLVEEIKNERNKLSYFSVKIVGVEPPYELDVNLNTSELSFFAYKKELNKYATRIWVESIKDSLEVFFIEKRKSYNNSLISSYYPHEVESFCWSREYGLVRYDVGGVVFELYEKNGNLFLK